MPPSRPLLLIYVARALRGFGDGFAVIILPAYLTALGYGPATVGIVATISLLGTAATTLSVGYFGRSYDLRNLLLGGALVMMATGLALGLSGHIVVIMLAVFLGTLNPTAGDTGLMVPIEHASLAQSAEPRQRTATFARYSLVGALATAFGALAAALPDMLATHGVEAMSALRAMFFLYAALGIGGAVLYARIPPLRSAESPPSAALGPSRSIVFKLAALFSLDSFAGGFTVHSLIALWLFVAFDMSLASASLFFFWSGLFSAVSFLFAARLSARIGLVNTMVYTHLPASLCMIAAAFAPTLAVALTLLLVRALLSQMDVPTRSSYVMAIVTPPERPAAASFTAAPRTLAQAISPAIAGALIAGAFPALPLIICGVLKIGYDLALLALFRNVRPPEEMAP